MRHVTQDSFDSILVRLKVPKPHLSSRNSRFDSILVRLKAYETATAQPTTGDVSIPYWFD